MWGSISIRLTNWNLEKGYSLEFVKSKDFKYDLLVLPSIYRSQVLQLLHDEQGYQKIKQTLALVRESFFWTMMHQDVTNWVKTCKSCKKAKGQYNNPNV